MDWTGPAIREADPERIEASTDDARTGASAGASPRSSDYLLLVENLRHNPLPFLNPTSSARAFAKPEVEARAKATAQGSRAGSGQAARAVPKRGRISRWHSVDRGRSRKFGPPSFVKLDVGSAPAGSRARRHRSKAGNVEPQSDTPETAKTEQYFYARRTTSLDTARVSDLVRAPTKDFLGTRDVKAQPINRNEAQSHVVNIGQEMGGF